MTAIVHAGQHLPCLVRKLQYIFCFFKHLPSQLKCTSLDAYFYGYSNVDCGRATICTRLSALSFYFNPLRLLLIFYHYDLWGQMSVDLWYNAEFGGEDPCRPSYMLGKGTQDWTSSILTFGSLNLWKWADSILQAHLDLSERPGWGIDCVYGRSVLSEHTSIIKT